MYSKKGKKNKSSTKKNRSKNAFTRLNCSPNPNKKDYSCLNDETLHKLRNLWNVRHPSSAIASNNPKEIWHALNKKLSSVCSRESCWFKQKFSSGHLTEDLKMSFAPVAPIEWKKNKNAWLSSDDIMNVMSQYEKAYHCFEFLGPTPIDFDKRQMHGQCVWDELCSFDLAEQISNKKTKIGIVFNTDPHNKDGSHWISMFINIRKGTIFFFDSVGDKAPRQIMTFVKRVVEQGRKLTTPISFVFDQNNPVEHQYGDTECGIYSLFFIAHLLEDKFTGHYLKTHVLKDKYMERFRKIYFNSHL